VDAQFKENTVGQLMTGGLANLGNTCGINTIVQCIAHTPTLYHLVCSLSARPIPKSKQQDVILTSELASILDGIVKQGQSLSPGRFIKAFYDIMKNWVVRGEQTDIVELWNLMVDVINEEVGRPLGADANANVMPSLRKTGDFAALVRRGDAEWTKQTAKVAGPWVDATHGMMVNQVHCKKCDKIYHNFETFTVLALPIPRNQSSCRLTDCLDLFFAEEQLSDWKCDCCKSTNDGWKAARIWRMPTVVVISLKRFETDGNGCSQKINTVVGDVEQISLSKWSVSMSGEEVGNRGLQLRAIGNHHGRYGGGHYLGLCRAVEDVWHMYDDLDVRDLNPRALCNEYNYILFYE